MSRQLISSGSPFEGEIGFSRAVRVGNRLEVSGTAPIRDGKVAGTDAYEQTKAALEIIIKAVEAAGGQASDIVRTRIFLTDMSTWKDAARASSPITTPSGSRTSDSARWSRLRSTQRTARASLGSW